MTQTSPHGITRLRSHSDFHTTVLRLTQALHKRDLKLTAVVDHAADAIAVGLAMPPTKLFIFGNPLAGTPIMLTSPSVAIDLPLKILIQEDGDDVWVSYNTPEYLRKRHGFSEAMIGRLQGISAICEEIAR